ncbi:MAG: glycoside hydrolase family 2 protein [Lachnospiraceae bacterium]|nr:glycoside hydrolase family 2 protein [Lachnospiraceae bacterium]
MRQVVNINQNWFFCKTEEIPTLLPESWELLNLPHTWNAVDGQDGGGDYFRGHGIYAKKLLMSELPEAELRYLEIRGANSGADVYWNGEKIAHHEGGYSTWRVLLPKVQKENLLIIDVDNSANDRIYPQFADFTFYGGLYRDVNVIGVSASHFALEELGTPGIKVTPDVATKSVEIHVFPENVQFGQNIRYTIKDGEGCVVEENVASAESTVTTIPLESIHLWHGRKDPYLYTISAELLEGEKVLDNVEARIGFRSFEVDPERGFILNGKEYPLRGVSRHQDRWGIGNALLPKHHREDMDLICELGANTIRLAHYQHDQYFYDLCDEKGMIIWAEIPYISKHLVNGVENTVSQMKELIIQNYNHPSIVCWGLSNEITMVGNADEATLENHRILNDLCHEMDKTRFTTMACFTAAPITDPYVQIPDTVSYNHYFGWYGGDTCMNGPWFDKFHEAHPRTPIGCSEYGCEALNWHTSDPAQGDYTEEYQAYYHEELIKQLFSRKYIWATHVWNMFDFGCDGRNEGGENGQNHKGLVTFDRSYKKDSFYAYKAWLSDEPFVHICGKRYVDRVEKVTKVTVYSNQPEVELFAGGVSLGKKSSPEHFFYYEVPNAGVTKLEAVAGQCKDYSELHKVEVFNEEYRFKEQGAILNWFEITAPKGYLSINDTLGDVMSTFRGKIYVVQFLLSIVKGIKKDSTGKDKSGNAGAFAGMLKNKNIWQMAAGFTIIRIANMVGLAGVKVEKETLLNLNKKLNSIMYCKK